MDDRNVRKMELLWTCTYSNTWNELFKKSSSILEWVLFLDYLSSSPLLFSSCTISAFSGI